MATDYNIDCALTTEIDVTQEVALTEEAIEAEIVVNSDDLAEAIPRIQVELGITQWSLVSDAIYIKNVTGEEPQWFKDIVEDIIREDDELLAEFEDIYAYINALENGYTNLVSITDLHTTQIVALKASTEEATAAIVRLDDVKVTDKQASAISSEVITAWMRGGESAAWFSNHVQAVATDTTANTIAIMQLGAEVDGIEASVTEFSEALVKKYENPEWIGPGDPDDQDPPQPQWIYEARAKHSLEVNANGSISGFVADAYSCDEGVPDCEGSRSSFKIYADEFLIADKLHDDGDPGLVAFLIKFSEYGFPPHIMLNGDVYFGDIDPGDGVPVEYTLDDIANDGVVDPVEKDALEKTFKDMRERDVSFTELVFRTDARYGILATDVLTKPFTDAYLLAYQEVQCLLANLGIREAYISGDSTSVIGSCPNVPYPDTYVGQTTYAPTTLSITRTDFNNYFKNYDIAYNKMNQMISDLVKEKADQTYNVLVEVFGDGTLSVAEKQTIRDYISTELVFYSEATAYVTGTLGISPNCGTYPYENGNGFPLYSRDAVIYAPYLKYGDFLNQAVAGTPIQTICPCSSGCPGNYAVNAFAVQMDLAVYDLYTAVDTIIDDAAAQAALLSLQTYLDAKVAYHDSLAASVVDTTFIKIVDPLYPADYTLIINDTIETGVIGDAAYLLDQTRKTGNGFDFEGKMIRVEDSFSPHYFRIDSEIVQDAADGGFKGICQDTNQSNIRAKFIEGGIGSFGTLYSGDTVLYANKKYKVNSVVVKNVSKVVNMYELGKEVLHTDSVRFYSTLNTTDTPEVNDSRIRKISESVFTASINGAFMDRLDIDDSASIALTLEYNTDDTNWVSVPNHVEDSFNNQTAIFGAMLCVNYVDFRMKISYESKGFPFMDKNVMFTIMLKN